MTTRRRKLTGSPAVPLSEISARFLGAPRETDGNRDWLREALRRFPARWTRYYLDLATDEDGDPIRRIAFPAPGEVVPDPLDRTDPVGERSVNPVPYVVRKHRDRAILLVTARCHVYCRFCFRRTFPDGDHRDPDEAGLQLALDYLTSETELREVILSGGDPLVLPDEELARIVATLSASPHLRSLRVHTRAPVHDPDRVTPELARVLAGGLPTWTVLHFDHPREVTPRAREAAAMLLREGLPLLDQTVLLAGVNDDVDVLERLFRELYAARIKPYYLHHPDRVPGAASFYVSIERGLEIYRELKRRLAGGPALPSYVIDLPDGSGKIPVESLRERGIDPEEPAAVD